MTNITKQMTSKNAKTLLFGGLLAMMILPFSMMDNTDVYGERTVPIPTGLHLSNYNTLVTWDDNPKATHWDVLYHVNGEWIEYGKVFRSANNKGIVSMPLPLELRNTSNYIFDVYAYVGDDNSKSSRLIVNGDFVTTTDRLPTTPSDVKLTIDADNIIVSVAIAQHNGQTPVSNYDVCRSFVPDAPENTWTCVKLKLPTDGSDTAIQKILRGDNQVYNITVTSYNHVGQYPIHNGQSGNIDDLIPASTDDGLSGYAAIIKNKIGQNDNAIENQSKLNLILSELNKRGISMEGQPLSDLNEFHSDGVGTSSESQNCTNNCNDVKSMKIRAAYKYFDQNLFGLNFYRHEKGSWSGNMYATADYKDVLVSVNILHAEKGKIYAYSVTASDNRPTTAVYDTFVNAIDGSGNYQFSGEGFTTRDNSAKYYLFSQTHSSPLSYGFYAGNWDVTVKGEVVSLS